MKRLSWKKLIKFFKSLNLIEWIELIVIFIIVICGISLVINIIGNVHKQDQEAFKNCTATYNETYCAREVYGIY